MYTLILKVPIRTAAEDMLIFSLFIFGRKNPYLYQNINMNIKSYIPQKLIKV